MPTERFTRDEISILVEALNSHAYWQLSDDDNRNDGYVVDEDATPELKACNALHTRLEKLSNAVPPSFLLSFDGRMALALSRIVQLAANLMRQESSMAKDPSPKLLTEIAFADAIAEALRDNTPLPDVPESVVPVIKPRAKKDA